MRVLAWVIAASVAVSAGGAPAAEPSCTVQAPPPAELAGWRAPVAIEAAANPAGATAAALAIGTAGSLALRKGGDVSFAATPGKPPAAGSSAGLASFTVTQAGGYRVALSDAAWVDVIADGKALASTAHGHGPACTGIRKMVDFTLQPGAYLLQIAGSPGARITALVARLR